MLSQHPRNHYDEFSILTNGHKFEALESLYYTFKRSRLHSKTISCTDIQRAVPQGYAYQLLVINTSAYEVVMKAGNIVNGKIFIKPSYPQESASVMYFSSLQNSCN